MSRPERFDRITGEERFIEPESKGAEDAADAAYDREFEQHMIIQAVHFLVRAGRLLWDSDRKAYVLGDLYVNARTADLNEFLDDTQEGP